MAAVAAREARVRSMASRALAFGGPRLHQLTATCLSQRRGGAAAAAGQEDAEEAEDAGKLDFTPNISICTAFACRLNRFDFPALQVERWLRQAGQGGCSGSRGCAHFAGKVFSLLC